MSRVDVVIPCYKYAHYLRFCVESVLTQKGVDVRALILDDASPDNTPEVAGQLQREDGRVEYRRHAVNRGHIATYNEGIEWASGDYLLLLSADDLLAPGALARAARVMDTHPEVGLVHGRQVTFTTEPGPAETPADQTAAPCTISAGEAFIRSCCAAADNPVATPTAVARTRLHQEVGGYRPSLPHTGDMEMWLRLAARASVAAVEAHQAYKRMHANNMQHQYAQALVELRHRQAAFDSFFAENRDRLQDAVGLQATAREALATQAFWQASRSLEEGDEAGCQLALDYAQQLCPALAAGREWARLRWKRRLGHRLWKIVHPVINCLRRARPASAASAK